MPKVTEELNNLITEIDTKTLQALDRAQTRDLITIKQKIKLKENIQFQKVG